MGFEGAVLERAASPQYIMGMDDYISVLKRRKFFFLAPFLLILLIAIVIAYALPAVYVSKATILIEQQEIPENIVESTVTGYVEERIEAIRQRLVTFDNLLEIGKKLNLYPELRKAGKTSEMVTKIRDNINVEMLDVKATDTGKGKSMLATIAFTVSYGADNPETAQKVAAELSNRYLEEDKEARKEQSEEVTSFLDKEAEKIRLEIVELEKKLASFKQEQMSQLPELMQVNMRLYEKTEGQIESAKDRIQKYEEDITAVQAELSLTDPRKAVTNEEGKLIQSPSERLAGLTAEFLQASSRYSPEHPDIIRLRREIQTLGSQTGNGAEVNRLVSELTAQRSKLLQYKQKYSSDHPDVLKLEKSVAALETSLRNMSVDNPKDSLVSRIPPDNPRYVALKTQLDAANANLKEERSKLKEYEKKLKEYETRLFKTPIVERDYQSLTRDYANAKAKYSDLKAKQLQARIAQQLESGNKGQRFSLVGAAYLPSSPDSPNRLGIILLGGLLAFSGGLGSVASAEYLDHSVRGKKGVLETLGIPPIAVIPYICVKADYDRRSKRRKITLAVFLVGLVLILLGIQFLWMPLDQVWLKITQGISPASIDSKN